MGRVEIISRSSEQFRNRAEAGRLLSEALSGMEDKNPVVLGIPRGGLVVAKEIAHSLGADFDVVLARKLGAPFNPELAVGAVGEAGKVFLNEAMGLDQEKEYLDREKERQLRALSGFRERVRSVIPKLPLKDRSVLITDDGIATGSTMRASIWSVRQESPLEIIAALPVAPEEGLQRVAADADRVICLRAPRMFAAVGQFYSDFRQIEDTKAESILRSESRRRKSGAGAPA